MKKIIVCLLITFIAFSTLGCDGSSDRAYKKASKMEGEELEDSAQIQEALFNRQKWTVTDGKSDQLPKYIGEMFAQKGGPDSSKIQIEEAFYNFNKTSKNLTMEIKCQINNLTRLIKIECGQASVEYHYLNTGNDWKVSLYDENNKAINEDWACSYNKSQIEKKFWKSEIYAAKIKDNVIGIIFKTNIKIEN